VFYQEIGGLGASSSQQTSLTVKISSSAVSTTSHITVRVSYYSDSTQKETIITIPIRIRRVPILQVTNVKYDVSPIEPGSTVLLSFDLVNNGDGSAKDVRIVLNQSDLFTVIESREIFINEIKAKRSENVSFLLTINPSASIGTYSVPLSLLFLDETKIESYSDIKYIGLVIAGQYNFIVTLESQSVVASGTRGTATIKIANAGTQDAQFLTVKVLPSDPLVEISPESIYIGSVKSDDYETEDFIFKVDRTTSSGLHPLNLKIDYKDLYSHSYSEIYGVDVKVSSMEEFSKAHQTGPSLFTIGIVVLVVIVCVYYIYKRLKKKR